MSPEVGVFKKLLSISHFFSKVLKGHLNLLFLIKHHLEEVRKGIIKNIYINGKTPVERNAMYYFYQYLLLLVVLTCWKRNTFLIWIKFQLKKRKFYFEPYFLLHLLCYIAHQWFIWTKWNLSFRIYVYIAPGRSQKIIIIVFTFVTEVKHTSWCLLRPWCIGHIKSCEK